MSYKNVAQATDIQSCAASYIGRHIHIVGEFAIQSVNPLQRATLYWSKRTKSPYIAISDHRGVMKKSLIILTLAILQCACAIQVDMQPAAKSMPGFDAISAEISVDYEKFDSAHDLAQTVALSITE